MRRCGVLIGVVVGLLACSGENATGSVGRRRSDAEARHEPQGEPMPHEECVASGGDIQSLDVNGDGQPDVRTVMEGGRPKCRETDANFDSRVDIYRWFDLSNGYVTRVEDDYDFDGRIDVVSTWENNLPVRDILDTNFDGRTDTWRDYREGHIYELRRDSDGDGRVDTWERFDTTGAVTYSAIDANHDGEPDGAPAATTPAATTPAATTPAATTPTPAATTPAATTPAATTPAEATPTPAAPAPAPTTEAPRAQKTREAR
ncbi:MAG: hypothetical protein U0326_25240 [Polyangiales bacterium]